MADVGALETGRRLRSYLPMARACHYLRLLRRNLEHGEFVAYERRLDV